MLTTSRRRGLVHAGSYAYRPVHGALGFMMSCAASVILLWVLIRLFREDEVSAESMQAAAGLAVVGCLLFYLGTTWFFSFITGYARKLTISEGGIRYGVAYFSWSQVEEIGARMKRGSFQVHVVLNRSWLASRWLLTDDGMSREMAEEFIEALRKQILPLNPRLTILKLPELPQASAVEAPSDVPEIETTP